MRSFCFISMEITLQSHVAMTTGGYVVIPPELSQCCRKENVVTESYHNINVIYSVQFWTWRESKFYLSLTLKGELQRQNKLISSERPFKILQNETKIIKIG